MSDDPRTPCKLPHLVWIGLQGVKGQREWSDGSPDDYIPAEGNHYLYWAFCHDVIGDPEQKKITLYLFPPALWASKMAHYIYREKETIEYHSQPQTWFCNLASSRNQFQLVHNDGDRLMMRSELQKAFDVANVPKRFADQVLFHIVYSDTSHSNHDETRTKQLKVDMEQSPQTMEYFNAIYYKDFELLGY
ncbi:unnamed protein product, partial [Mesorhabditis belari]|uniref:Uncharacterized protein n=1 Tax=Mesorhabditis belari TaxID=2138241 RepID=A0AAF3FJT4_9BILA